MSSGNRLVEPGLRPRIIFVSKFGAALLGFYILIALNPVNDHVIVPSTEWIATASAAVLRLWDGGVEAAGTVIAEVPC